MAKIIYKSVKHLRKNKPRNELHAEALKSGILRSQTIGDKRAKTLENEHKKRLIAIRKMNEETYDET